VKTIIHVNQHVIKDNTKTGVQNPPLTVKDYKRNRRATTAQIVVDGRVVAEVVYQPNKPLSCGARVWIQTNEEVRVQ